MAKSGNRGIALLIVAMIVAALVYRFWPRGSSSTEKPLADAAAARPQTDGSVARADATQETPPDAELGKSAVDTSFHPGEWQLSAFSITGNKVLLYRPPAAGEPTAYRVVALPKGSPGTDLETELELTSYKRDEPLLDEGGIAVYEGSGSGTRPSDAELIEAHLADHKKLWALLREFPLGAGEASAATPDGKRGAFNYADHLYVIRNGKPFKVPLPAAYDPMILADGKTVVFRGYDGQFDGPGTGRYSLFWMNLDSGKPVKVPGTEAAVDNWALSRDGKFLRIVVAELPWVQPCLLEIPLVTPLKISKKRCFDGDGHVQLSRHGDRAMWSLPLDKDTDSTIGNPIPTRQRVRAIELDRGSVPFDQMVNGSFQIADGGRILLDAGEATFDIDGNTTREVELDRVTQYCRFLDDTTVVCPDLESVKQIDLTAI